MLRVLGKFSGSIPPVIPDGIFGPGTMQAIAAFQRQNGMPASGIADQNTWEAIVAAYEEAILYQDKGQSIEALIPGNAQYGMDYSGPYVYLLHALLLQLSNDHTEISPPIVTGTIDRDTQDALRGFQQLAGLEETGIFDRKTWKHLVLHFVLNAHKQQAVYREKNPSLL